jgi:hypothetical protein
MKLTNQERDEYRDLKAGFKFDGGKFIRGYACGRDLTLAVFQSGAFYHIAVAVQGRDDLPNKRRGKYEALCKLYNGNYLPLPRGCHFQIGTIDASDLQQAFENNDLLH